MPGARVIFLGTQPYIKGGLQAARLTASIELQGTRVAIFAPGDFRYYCSQGINALNRAIPIIKLHDALIVSIQVELSDHLVQELNDSIAEEISKRSINGLVIEVSGVGIFDSYIARAIRNLAQMAHLMGVRTIIAGLNAGVAITLVEMGSLLSGLTAVHGLEEALEILSQRSEAVTE